MREPRRAQHVFQIAYTKAGGAHDGTTGKRAVRSFRWALLAAGAAAAAGCGSGAPSQAQASQVAGQARPAVAREYWNVFDSIESVIEPGLSDGNGFYSPCPASPGQASQQVAYNVTVYVAARNHGLTPARFRDQIERILRSRGWSAFRPSQGYLLSSKTSFHVYLKQQSGQHAYLLGITVNGPCVTTGAHFASHVNALNQSLQDEYPNSAASARPVPTAPLPSP